MNVDNSENVLIRMTTDELMDTLMSKGMLKGEMKCVHCLNCMDFVASKHHTDGKCWRCKNKTCIKKRPRCNIRKKSFFERLSLPLLTIIKVLIKWSLNQQQIDISFALGIDSRTVKKSYKIP